MKIIRATEVALVLGILMNPLASAQVYTAQSKLDDGRQWLAVDAPPIEDLPTLHRAAAAAALNDTATAEPLLQSIIREQPYLDAVNHAYELLSRIYLRSGQYGRLIQNLDNWARAFPDSPEVLEEQADVELFRGLPDQINGPRHLSRLDHEGGEDFDVSLSINDQPATYLLDTGAWVSVMTEPEAARLGLVPGTIRGRIGDASGTGTVVRTTVVKELMIGSMTLRDVSFVIVPNEEAGGIIGMPILLALGRIEWSSEGSWELGGSSESSENPGSDLVFYENKLLLSAEVLEQPAFGTLDTGAATTDLNRNFATQFAEFVERTGTKQTGEITGLGGTAEFDAVLLPELRFFVGGTNVSLNPALVTLQAMPGMGGECCIGNIGRDMLLGTGRLTIDFSSMMLRLD
jgi:hypothetical protein